MNDEEQYCLDTLLRVKGHSCKECGKLHTEKCRTICKVVERHIS